MRRNAADRAFQQPVIHQAWSWEKQSSPISRRQPLSSEPPLQGQGKHNQVMQPFPLKILVIDDDPVVPRKPELGSGIGFGDCTCSICPDPSEALAKMQVEEWDLVVTELSPESNHLHGILKQARACVPPVPVAVLPRRADPAPAAQATQSGVRNRVVKESDPGAPACRLLALLNKLTSDARPDPADLSAQGSDNRIHQLLQLAGHDIRGSLTAMTATLKLLDRDAFGKLPPNLRDVLRGFYRRMVRLMGLTEDLLGKVSMMDGILPMNTELLDFRQDIIDPVLSELEDDFLCRQITLAEQWTPIPGNTLRIQASRIWLRAVYRNLLSNAVKYGAHSGTIALGYRENGAHFTFGVFNTGNPVPEHRSRTLFSRPAAHGKSAPSNAGIGLGLILTQQIIRQHGGNLWYEAHPQGSNFVFSLPSNLFQVQDPAP